LTSCPSGAPCCIKRTINPVPRQTLLETVGEAGAWHRRREQAGHAPEEAGLPHETIFDQLAETWNNGTAPDADRDAVTLARRASGIVTSGHSLTARGRRRLYHRCPRGFRDLLVGVRLADHLQRSSSFARRPWPCSAATSSTVAVPSPCVLP
jgi:hypothetical protein